MLVESCACYYGAAAIDPEVSKGLHNWGFSVLQGYGLTECAPLVTGNRDFIYRDDSAGLAIPGVEVKIDNPDKKGIGEILIRGSNVMQGYFNNPEETDKVLKDGWFHSGDLGRIDKKGFLYITGRCKNVIVTKNGKNIFPEELESYLKDSPYVGECIVYGELDKESEETHIKAQIFPDIEVIREKLKNINNIDNEEIKSDSRCNKNVNKYPYIRYKTGYYLIGFENNHCKRHTSSYEYEEQYGLLRTRRYSVILEYFVSLLEIFLSYPLIFYLA